MITRDATVSGSKYVFNCAIRWEVLEKNNPCANVPLFEYQSRAWQLGWQWQFGR